MLTSRFHHLILKSSLTRPHCSQGQRGVGSSYPETGAPSVVNHSSPGPGLCGGVVMSSSAGCSDGEFPKALTIHMSLAPITFPARKYVHSLNFICCNISACHHTWHLFLLSSIHPHPYFVKAQLEHGELQSISVIKIPKGGTVVSHLWLLQ